MASGHYSRRLRRLGRGLTDDLLLVGPRNRTLKAYLTEGVDRLVGADPGLSQLRTALQAVIGIAAAVGLVDAFVHVTGELRAPVGNGRSAPASGYNHALLIVSMLLAGMVAMMASFAVTDRTAQGQVVSTLLLPVPMVASIAVGLALGPYRVPSLVFLVVLLTVAVYVRRWGPRGFAAGLVAFNGGFLGFFLHAEVGLRHVGWLAADVGVGVLAALIVRFTLFRPDPERTLARMRRSWQARARRLMVLCVAALDADDTSGQAALRDRLRRQVVRLNESTLMIDAQLGESAPELADVHARRLFDAELALANCARFASALASVCTDPAVRGDARAALTALAVDDEDAAVAAAKALQRCTGDVPRTTVLAHRLGASVADFVAARRQLDEVITAPRDGRPVEAFTPAVELRAGFLPGSVPVSTAASTTPGRRPLDRAAMPPYVRASIQIAVAGSLALIVGDAVSGPHLQWAVLATFLAFMATTNAGEQVRKALFRVTGTAIGIVLGDLLVRLTGGHVWSSLLIVLVALFFGIYLIRVNYTFMVIGITVTLSQLYAQLGELSWHLLLVRLGETAIGVAAVILTVLLIVPLRPRRVLTAGLLLWFRALSSLLDSVMHRLLGIPSEPLRPKVRELDAAYAALEATAAPLRSTTFGRASDTLSEIRSITAAARSYARSLAVQAELTGPLHVPALHAAARQLHNSSAAIDSRIETGQHTSYVRCASLLATAAASLPATETSARLALRDLSLLDGALARLAAALDMDIGDLDTAIADATARNRSTQTGQR